MKEILHLFIKNVVKIGKLSINVSNNRNEKSYETNVEFRE